MKLAATALLWFFLFHCWAPSGHANSKLTKTLKNVYVSNMKALQKKDVSAAMRTVHRQSPVYASTESLIGKLIEIYELKYSLVSFRLVGGDNDYQVARVKQKTMKIKGPEFRDNVADTMQIFRKEGKSWKIWQSVILSTSFIDNPQKRSNNSRATSSKVKKEKIRR